MRLVVDYVGSVTCILVRIAVFNCFVFPMFIEMGRDSYKKIYFFESCGNHWVIKIKTSKRGQLFV